MLLDVLLVYLSKSLYKGDVFTCFVHSAEAYPVKFELKRYVSILLLPVSNVTTILEVTSEYVIEFIFSITVPIEPTLEVILNSSLIKKSPVGLCKVIYIADKFKLANIAVEPLVKPATASVIL